ncbi:MAG TPA: hypothetical protein VG871_16310 [Vicinamibacterales bacterium]|nr:hypothetical protein [Vicinamibacterales bacterium]
MRRVNLFDAAVAVFVLVLIPIAYGTYLLFRTPHPVISSVTRVEITKEERRVAGPNLVAKLKVRGSGLRPMLRASIDDLPAVGFVFETPNSADLLVGSVPAGPHDLVLYDGVQEVARAPKAVTIQPIARHTAMLRVRFDAPPEVLALVTPGDTDLPADQSAAVVMNTGKDATALRAGVEEVDGGIAYRGLPLKPGVEFTLSTPAYVVKGTMLSVSVEGQR